MRPPKREAGGHVRQVHGPRDALPQHVPGVKCSAGCMSEPCCTLCHPLCFCHVQVAPLPNATSSLVRSKEPCKKRTWHEPSQQTEPSQHAEQEQSESWRVRRAAGSSSKLVLSRNLHRPARHAERAAAAAPPQPRSGAWGSAPGASTPVPVPTQPQPVVGQSSPLSLPLGGFAGEVIELGSDSPDDEYGLQEYNGREWVPAVPSLPPPRMEAAAVHGRPLASHDCPVSVALPAAVHAAHVPHPVFNWRHGGGVGGRSPRPPPAYPPAPQGATGPAHAEAAGGVTAGSAPRTLVPPTDELSILDSDTDSGPGQMALGGPWALGGSSDEALRHGDTERDVAMRLQVSLPIWHMINNQQTSWQMINS